MADISLSAGIRSSLLQLQSADKLFNRTTERLATGKEVNSAIDNPTNYFAAVNLSDRAEGLSARLDDMGQAIQRIQAADNGVTTIRGLISAMKGVVNNALSTSDSDARASLGDQFNDLIDQINDVAKDSTYQGLNLLQSTGDRGETQTVQFNETFGESTLSVEGFSVQGSSSTALTVGDITGGTAFSVSGDGEATNAVSASLVFSSQDTGEMIGIQGHNTGAATSGSGGTINFGDTNGNYVAQLSDVIEQLESFDEALKSESEKLATNLTIITTREDFTNEFINTLNEGADKLTLADLNEEGANLLALQTANALATQSLALASQQSQGVLQLLG
ncbi:MAG: flagellin [Verrucomicrobiae bacterium]|nr:flagellin [Verrucomicrobiae bacterium]